MNQLFGQPADSSRPSFGDLGQTPVGARPLPVAGAEQAFFHLDVKRSLQLHWRLALSVAAGGVVLAIAYFLTQALVRKTWPSYEAESMVYVQPTPPRVLEPNNGGSPRWPYDNNTYESYIQQQMMNVTREDVMEGAVRKLDAFKGPKESDQAAAQRLAQSLAVNREGTGYQFSIVARARTAAMAAQLANQVTAAYIESASRDQHQGDAQRLSMLRDERDRIDSLLAADRSEQQALNKQLGVASVASSVPDHYDEDIASTRAELIKARTDHDASEAKFAALGAGNGPSSAAIDAAAEEMIASDAGLVSMKTALNTRRAALISQMANLTPSHPQYKQDEVELEKIDTDLENMLKDLRAKAAARMQLQLKSDLERTAGVEAQVNGQLRQLVGAAGSATPKMQRSSDLAADITRLQERYATVDEQLHNLLLEDHAPAVAVQVTAAEPPLTRTKSGVVRNTFVICFGGVLLGILAAVVAQKLDPKIYIAKDVELILGFPPMAQLPDFDEVSEGVAEEYLLRLSSSIEHARKQSHLRSCVFTGVAAGSGVSLLMNRVGDMLDAMGRPTVMVDATGAPPSGHRGASGAGAPGLVPVEKVIRPTALLQQMAEESEHQDESLVLTDTAPLLVSAETEYLARFVDCVIVIIQSGSTTRRQLREAANNLQRLDVASVGFVLNRVGLAKAEPNFRLSVEAIEQHMKALGSRVAKRPERSKPFIPEAPVAEETTREQKASHESVVPSRFEPDLAAAAAAVERFSHPAAVAEAEACLPTPTMHVTAAEVARRFSIPLAGDGPAPPETAAAGVQEEEQLAGPELEPLAAPATVDETEVVADDVSPPTPLPAPFEEAARHVASVAGTEAGAAFAAAPVAPWFAELSRHAVAPEQPEAEDSTPLRAPAATEQELVSDAADAPQIAEAAVTPVELSVDAAQEELHSEAVEPNLPQPTASFLSEFQAAATTAAEHQPAAAELQPAAAVHAPKWVETVPREDAVAADGAVVETLAAPMDQAERQMPHDLPWPMMEPSRAFESKRPPVLWQAARQRFSYPVDPEPKAPPDELGSKVSRSQRWEATAHAWGQASEPPRRDPVTAGAPATGVDAEPANLTSRLSGLRSLLYVMGVRNTQGGDDRATWPAAQGVGFDSLAGRESFEPSDAQDAEEVMARNIGGAAPRLVTAPPEFLPPKPGVVSVGRESAPVGESATRQDRRAAYDGIEILPSKRGQYKKI